MNYQEINHRNMQILIRYLIVTGVAIVAAILIWH